MGNEKQVKPYLKCRFCRVFNKRDYNPCTTFFFKKGLLCNYNTQGSIWKWLVRFSLFICPFPLLIWYYFLGLSNMINMFFKGSSINSVQFIQGIIALILSVLMIITLLATLIVVIADTHHAFRYSYKGRYFKKEERRYKIFEEDSG